MKQSHEVAQSSDDESPKKNTPNSLSFDEISQEIGEFGLYQILVGVLVGLVLLLTSSALFNFVFTSEIPAHRCLIPQCEQPNTNDFNANWTNLAIPYNKNGRPESCSRFQYIPTPNDDGTCSEHNFNRTHVIQCDDILVKNNEERLVTLLNMLCTGDEDKLALIGTASTFGRLAGMPFAGIISDKYGRLITIIGCLLLGSIFGCLQALPAPIMSFELYLTLEFLVAVSLAGILGAAYVYLMEWASAKYRVYVTCIGAFFDSAYPIYVGFGAWYFEHNFSAFRLFLAIPGLCVICLYFILGESPRWLLAGQKYKKAINSISKAARINGRSLHNKTIEIIQTSATNTFTTDDEVSDDESDEEVTLVNVLRQKILAFRLFILALVWVFTIFAYYGIVMISKDAHENKYASYIVVGLAEIPGVFATMLLLDRFGRRMSIGVPLLIYGLVLIMTIFLSDEQDFLKLILLVIGRAAIVAELIALSTYTNELWPTAIRNTAYNICSMAGRIGSITASLSVLLRRYFEHLPVILYGSVTIVGAVFLFAFLPETANCEKLPDSIEESVAIGKNSRKQSRNCDI